VGLPRAQLKLRPFKPKPAVMLSERACPSRNSPALRDLPKLRKGVFSSFDGAWYPGITGVAAHEVNRQAVVLDGNTSKQHHSAARVEVFRLGPPPSLNMTPEWECSVETPWNGGDAAICVGSFDSDRDRCARSSLRMTVRTRTGIGVPGPRSG
jgi:hypothetical protein